MQTTGKSLAFALVLQSLLTSCASITGDVNQSIRIETYSKDLQGISGAICSVKNEYGEWFVSTPGSVYVSRSAENLQVTCNKDGEGKGEATLISRANAGMFGNLVIGPAGAAVGAIVDHKRGAAYNYPDWVRVILGDNLVFDRRQNQYNEMMTGKRVTAEPIKKASDCTDEADKSCNP